jgi:hypothetical protein
LTTRSRALLFALTLLAFLLRVWGTSYALSLPIARPDEDRWVRVGLGLLEDPNPRWFQWPTLHAYLLAALYGAWGVFRLWRGDFPSWHAYMNEPQDIYLADLVLLGRYSSALIGALVVPLTNVLGEKIGPRGSGLVAAALMAVAFSPVRDAHWALIEPLLLLGIVTTLILALRALERPTLGRFVLAGVAAGLTTSAKYSAATLAAPIAVAVFAARFREGRPLVGAFWDVRALASAAAMALCFAAGSPYMLVSTREFMDAMTIREWSYRDASFGTDVGFVHHLSFSLRYSHGVAAELIGVAGLLALSFKSAARATVLAYGVATYLALGPARIVPMRYASSLAPCVVLGVAWVLFAVPRARRATTAIAGGVALLAAEPLYRDIAFDRLLTREDTRVSAREWALAQLQPGARILAPDSKALRWGRPILEDRYVVSAHTPGKLRRAEAEWLLLAESPTGYVPWAPDLHEAARASGRLAAAFDPYAPGAAPRYDPHDAFFVPVAGFAGVRAPGPRITVYRLSPR